MSVWKCLQVAQLGCASMLAGACSGGGEAHVDYPEGTVIALELDGRPATISGAEVDRWLPTIEVVEPTATLPALRRFALTNIVLPKAVAGLIDPDAREEARLRAHDSWDVVQEGLIEYKDLLEMKAVEGTFKQTGLDVWGMALEMEEDSWSPIFETVGAYIFFRFVAIPSPPWDSATPILIECATFPYLDPTIALDQVQDALDQTELTIVDPEWETLLPAVFRYSMKAD